MHKDDLKISFGFDQEFHSLTCCWDLKKLSDRTIKFSSETKVIHARKDLFDEKISVNVKEILPSIMHLK